MSYFSCIVEVELGYKKTVATRPQPSTVDALLSESDICETLRDTWCVTRITGPNECVMLTMRSENCGIPRAYGMFDFWPSTVKLYARIWPLCTPRINLMMSFDQRQFVDVCQVNATVQKLGLPRLSVVGINRGELEVNGVERLPVEQMELLFHCLMGHFQSLGCTTATAHVTVY